jgi:hypothetical protein
MKPTQLSSIRFFLILIYTNCSVKIRRSKNPLLTTEQLKLLEKADAAPQEQLHAAVMKMIAGLTPARQRVVMRICGIDTEPVTYEALGHEMGMGRGSIRQHLLSALRHCNIPEHRKPVDEILFGTQPTITLESSLYDVEWPTIVKTFFVHTGFTTFAEITARSTGELKKIRYGGNKTIRLISEKLEGLGFCLRDQIKASNVGSVEETLDLPFETLGLSVRAEKVCKAHKVMTVKDVTRLTERQLYYTRNCGKKTTREIREKLAIRGLYLGMHYN